MSKTAYGRAAIRQALSRSQERDYIAIDMKSFYASVECVSRGLDPLKAYLLVADESRSDSTIVLAVSPALKAIGVPSRPRLFEAKEKIRQYETAHKISIDYITATPRMAEYERVSADIMIVHHGVVVAIHQEDRRTVHWHMMFERQTVLHRLCGKLSQQSPARPFVRTWMSH